MHREQIQPGNKPVLLFLHGTASSTKGAFSALSANEQPWQILQSTYEGRVFGFEHRTLTESPVQNVVQLLQELPTGEMPPLHLVSHSRGGLVGDLLCHGGLSEEVFPEQLLRGANVPKEQIPLYRELNQLLADNAPKVERFVRVACPAAGTTLASKRLDIYLSLLIHALGSVPAAGPFLAGLGELAAAVAKERLDPETLPGLEAQMPTSSLIRLLNGSGHVLDSDLTVIAGDSDGFVKNLANLFYWRANDLVVDTRSMYGGAQRKKRIWYRAEGKDVHHCNYFENQRSVKKLVAGLTRADDDLAEFETARPKGVSRGAARGAVEPVSPENLSQQPAVVLIPGIMGSHLSVVRNAGMRDRVWLDIPNLMMGGITDLQASKTGVLADALVGLAYEDFSSYLNENGHYVLPFPYDWRLSILAAADELAVFLESRLKASNQPIRLVAHSMGGLVARALIAKHRTTWDRIVDGGGRLIQLGTPNGGSYLIPTILRGEAKLLKRLALVDLTHSLNDWVELVSAFPGLLEMSPQTANDPKFFERKTWTKFGAKKTPTLNSLRKAVATKKVIQGVRLSDHDVVYVAGKADETPTLAGGSNIASTAEGDGRVVWETGNPDEDKVPQWFVDAKHGSLADYQPSFEGLLDLIVSGTTTRLSKDPPKVSRSVTPLGLEGVIVQREMDIFPSQNELTSDALDVSFH